MIGAIFVNVEIPEFKRVLIYIATFVRFLSFDNYLGWLLGLGVLFLWRGFYFINLLLI